MLATTGSAATINVVGCSPDALVASVEQGNADATADTIVLQAGCTYSFVGAYGATSYALPSISTDITILGNGARVERVPGSPSFSLFSVSSAGVLLLSNVTLAEGWGSRDVGANITNGGSLTLLNSTITNAVPFGQQGAGIINRGAMAVIGSTIENQFNVDGTGGGIDNRRSGTLALTGSTLSRNGGPAPASDQFANGGAITNAGAVTVYGSTFVGNSAEATGGAISNGGSIEIHGSSFVGNNGGNFGGAIVNYSDLIVKSSYFEDNRASIGGGAIYNGSVALAQVVNSTFYRNMSASPSSACCVGGTGGAILNRHSLRVEQSTFFGNRASNGTVVDSPSGGVSFEASILDGSGVLCSGTIFDFDYNVVHGGSGCPASFTSADPLLVGAPSAHGGATKTLALGVGSAAVDIVPTTGCPSYDQRGSARPAGPLCDAGALEDQLPTTPGTPSISVGGTPNTGSFTLAWNASTDAESQPTYRLYHKDANDPKFGLVATTSGPFYAFSVPEAEGTFRYIAAADDGNHYSLLSPASTPVVVDRSSPTAPSAAADRSPDAAGWYRDTVTVSFSGSTDPTLPDGSPGSGVQSTTAPQTRNSSGTFAVGGKSTDAAGNESAVTNLTVNVDAEAPAVSFNSCAADVILGSTASAAWVASDSSSGLQTAASGNIALDTATIGSRSVSASATDKVGHVTTTTCNYRVIFDFSGFFAPLKATPALQTWKGGDSVPITFGLAGDKGLAVIAAGYPQSAQFDCASTPELDSGTPTTASKRLEYKTAQGGRYKYLWVTQPGWAGTCRQFVLKLTDNTFHRANFRFT